MIEHVDDIISQYWYGENEWNQRYYYPVLPKLNKLGKLDIDFGLQGKPDPENIELEGCNHLPVVS